MKKQQCAKCDADVSLDKYQSYKEGVGIHCDDCDSNYCPKHFKELDTFYPAPGVDTEVTRYSCPEGHEVWD